MFAETRHSRATDPAIRAASASASQIIEFRENGLIESEVRILAASIEAFVHRADEKKVSRAELVELYRGFSTELELSQTAVNRYVDCGYLADRYQQLTDAIRTYLEEGILRIDSADPWTPTEICALIKREYTLSLEMDFKSSIPSHQGFSIYEFDPERITVSPSLLNMLSEICNDLVIDPDLLTPQEGFLAPTTPQELEYTLATEGSRLLVPYFGGHPIGAYDISTSESAIPKSARNALTENGIELSTSGGDGWARRVAITKSGSEKLKCEGFNAYKAVTDAVIKTACSRGIERLWAHVRIGEQGNLAKAKHEAVGWIPTGFIEQHAGHPYELLLLKPFEVLGNKNKPSYYINENQSSFDSNGWLKDFGPLTLLSKDFRLQQTPTSSPSLTELDPITALQIALAENGQILQSSFENNRWVVQFQKGDQRFDLTQKIPGQDLWKIEYAGFYERGLSTPLRPLSAVLGELDA